MAFVASFKNPLEIEGVLSPVFDGTGAGTKPVTLLKKQIPIRTFGEWDEQCPGFVEIDLVAHDGGLVAGDYCQTCDTR